MNTKSHAFITFIVLVSISYLIPQIANAKWYKDTRAIMGTEIRVEFWSDENQEAELLLKQVMTEMHRIDKLMSPFIKTSQLSEINRLAATQKVIISNELFQLIQKSIEISELTNGAFDITFASIGNLYDYRLKKKPTQKLIKQHLNTINYKYLVLDTSDNSIKFAQNGVVIDLGGIAKGHAVDRSIEILRKHNIQHGLVSAGGDTKILGDHRGRPWVTGIRDPRVKGKSAILIPLKNVSISTSGDYERYFVEDGVRYHHIISPKTGASIKTVRSVSVIGPSSTTCDALSTSLFVLGTTRALELINKISKYDAIIIDSEGKLIFSEGLQNPKSKN